MKSLSEYIKESMSINEGSADFARLTTDVEDVVTAIKKAAESSDVYFEKTDNGCKVKLSKDKDYKTLIDACDAIKQDLGEHDEIEAITSAVDSLKTELLKFVDANAEKGDETPEDKEANKNDDKDDKSKDDDKSDDDDE